MKIKSGFMLRSIAGSYIVVPVGKRSADFNGMITLNETSAFLWKQLETGATEEELAAAILRNYEDVDEAQAKAAVRQFLDQLREVNCFE